MIKTFTYDKNQMRIITTKHKTTLVLAGAGSGKTTTIIGRIKYLLANGISNKDILCLSFTNETVDDLRRRLLLENIDTNVMTFHKLALQIIGNNYQVAASDLLEYIIEEYFTSSLFKEDRDKIIALYLSEETNIDILKRNTMTFIAHFKALNYNKDILLNILRDSSNSFIDKVTLVFIINIYNLYEEELRSTNHVDFSDMINIAIKYVEKSRYFKYKHIIVDEFQDVSFSRYSLIKTIKEKFDPSLMVVGDDFQSIYSFTGCNLDVFLNMKRDFPKLKTYKLKNNYRNSKDIVDITRRFILKNRRQINKRLRAHKYLKRPIKIVYSSNISFDVRNIIDKEETLILIRNNRDINLLLGDDIFKRKDSKTLLYSSNKEIKYLTVHASKGLESENIIILNAIDEKLGFPNKLENHNLVKKLYPKSKEKIAYAEERRLFYVALTRTKNNVYIFTNKINPSLFVQELLRDYKYKIEIIDLIKKQF